MSVRWEVEESATAGRADLQQASAWALAITLSQSRDCGFDFSGLHATSWSRVILRLESRSQLLEIAFLSSLSRD